MATASCSKNVTIRIWDSDSTIVATINAALDAAATGGALGSQGPGLFQVTDDPSVGSPRLWNTTDGDHVACRGGGYGDAPTWPPVVLVPIDNVPGWTACDAVQATAISECNAGMVSLNPLLNFELDVATALSWTYAGRSASACTAPPGGNIAVDNGGSGVRLVITRIGQP